MRNLHDDTIKSSTNAVTNTDIGNVTANGNYATKSLDNYGDLMSVADLAMFLGVSKQTVYSEIREGKFCRISGGVAGNFEALNSNYHL